MSFQGNFTPAIVTTASITNEDVASGSIQNDNLGSGAVQGFFGFGHIASGTVGAWDLASGCVMDYIACEEAISGMRAVAWGSGGCFVVNAQRTSGLRMPAVGVAVGNYASGAVVSVIRRGTVRNSNSGTFASGFITSMIYVGSGGLLISQSGYMGGASSGHGAEPTAAASGYSGALVQTVGIIVSGGVDIQIGELRSGLLSGGGSQF